MRRYSNVLVILATTLPVPAAAGPPEGMRLVFEDSFARLDLRGPAHPDGRWDTKFHFGGRTLATNGELELYVDPEFLGLGLNPFSSDGGPLAITADRTPAGLQGKLAGQPYVSGLLTTEHSFAQTYGYFEIRARLPAGKGLWPAFWLLPLSRAWPPEIDIFEVLGDNPRRLYMTVHSTMAKTMGFEASVADTSADFHDYGVLWTKERIAWYFDGRQMAEAPTPADLHQPMYLLVNLAVGGRWPGPPDSETRFPATMRVARVRAFAIAGSVPALPIAK